MVILQVTKGTTENLSILSSSENICFNLCQFKVNSQTIKKCTNVPKGYIQALSEQKSLAVTVAGRGDWCHSLSEGDAGFGERKVKSRRK